MRDKVPTYRVEAIPFWRLGIEKEPFVVPQHEQSHDRERAKKQALRQPATRRGDRIGDARQRARGRRSVLHGTTSQPSTMRDESSAHSAPAGHPSQFLEEVEPDNHLVLLHEPLLGGCRGGNRRDARAIRMQRPRALSDSVGQMRPRTFGDKRGSL